MKGFILSTVFLCNIVGISIGIFHGDVCSVKSYTEIISTKARSNFDLIFIKPFVIIAYPGIYVGHKLVRPWSCD